MKKWLISLPILVLFFVAGIYIFIPSRLSLSSVAYISCTPGGAFRILSDESQWPRWWPGAKAGDTSFEYKGDVYHITKKMYNSLELSIRHSGTDIDSKILLLPLSMDSLALQWQCQLPAGINPFTRLAGYRQAVHLKKSFDDIIRQLESFLEKKENIYGFNIERKSTTDTLLVATKTILPDYPSTQDIYQHINILKQYIGRAGARETGYPIMNVTPVNVPPTGIRQFQLMVAIPTDRPLTGNGAIFFRKMIPGAFMVADVKGGDKTVVHALQQMQVYFDDYKRTAMAIPFAALITDRISQPDTTQWHTRIYAPVY